MAVIAGVVRRTRAARRKAGAAPLEPGQVRLRWWFLFGAAVSYLGMGLGGTVTTLYLTEICHAPVAQVTGCLSAAGLAGIGLTVVAGRGADRFGPVPVYAGLLAVMAAGRVLVLLGEARPLLYATLFVTTAPFPALVGVRASLVAAAGPRLRTAIAAQGRAMANLGYGAGAAGAAAALAWGTLGAYRIALIACAVLSLAAVAAVGPLPRQRNPMPAPRLRGPRSRNSALADPGYLLLAATSGGVLMLYDAVLSWALPLWVARSTRAPAAVCAIALIVNTLGVGVGQVAVSKRVLGVNRAARVSVASGAVMAAACLVILGSAAFGPVCAALLLILAALMLTLAELAQSAGAIVLSYALAPEDRLGEYQGIYASGFAVISCLAPAALGVVLAHPGPGWWLLAGLLVSAGFPLPSLARRAQQAAGQSAPAVAERDAVVPEPAIPIGP